jgi:lipid II:glycine glycyltransferase (peptidoglycan interpeptide bridge formation enzyme)
VIGAIIISFFGGMATYLHGASSNLHRNVMVNYAIQWRAIQDAKSHGCEKYDFGGIKITEENNKNSWQGITRFKLSFAPKEKIVDFPGCWDIVINKRRYFTYRALQYLKDLI